MRSNVRMQLNGAGGLAAIVGLQFMVAPAAMAQTSDTAGNGAAGVETEEVVVTAQRRKERLQDVPIAISALGADTLAERGVDDVSALRGSVPGLSISNFGGVNVSNLVAIRGVSGQPLPIGAGQATAMYIDGVYLSRPDAGFFALDDVERLEVLRGPQGTLYGRNATAGAINIITREPGQQRRGGFDLSYGNFASVRAKGSLNGGLTDRLSAGISASYDRRDGYFVNTVTNSRIGDRSSYTVRGKLHFESGAFDATLASDYSAVSGAEMLKNLVIGGVYVGMGNPDVLSSDIADRALTEIRSKGASLTMNLEATDHFVLTSITAWRKATTLSVYDGDGSAAAGSFTGGDNASETLNQELRGVLTLPRFRATMGANYFHEKASFGLSIGPPTLPLSYASPFDTTKLDAYAAFGQFEYDLTPRLAAVAGLRFNHEKRDFTTDYRTSRAAGTGAAFAGLRTAGSLKDDVWLPSIGLNLKATPDILLYAKASQGYQAPGFNFAPGPFVGADIFDAEKLWAYEAGIKSQFLDRRATLNVAGFYYDYTSIQIRSVTAPGVTTVDNAASATLKGIEAELTIRPTEAFTLSGQVAYVDARYGAFCQPISAGTPQANDPSCATGIADRSGNRLNQAPKWSGGVNLNYEAPVTANATLKANVGYSLESSVFYTTANETPAANPDGWRRLDARLALAFDHGLEVYAYGRNLNDNRYIGQVFRLSAVAVLGAISEPRTYGIGLKYKY